MSYTVQKKAGRELNRPFQDDLPIHDWYRFVLSFPPHLVQEYISKFNIKTGHVVLDPFAGTGTTLVECKKNSIESIGFEANPIAHFASKTKTNWTIRGKDLKNHAKKIAIITESKLTGNRNGFRVLNEEQKKLLIADSISEIPLTKALVLLDTIDNNLSEFNEFERLAFAKQLVFNYSNLKFGPEVGVSRKKKEDVNTVDLWLEGIEKMADDLDYYSSYSAIKSTSIKCDSRIIPQNVKHNSIDFVITSPPYPNEKDYTRTTRLESVVLGYLNTSMDLRELKKSLLRSNTRNIYKGDTDDKLVENIKSIKSLSALIEDRRLELGKTSGFEKLYHKVVTLYFGGMAKHLADLKPFLKKDSKLAYVVGQQASFFRIPINTAELLGEVAESIGYKIEGIELFRERFSTATKTKIKEEVLILTKPN